MAFDQCLSYSSYLVETCKHYKRPVVNFTSFRTFAIFALWKRATFLIKNGIYLQNTKG